MREQHSKYDHVYPIVRIDQFQFEKNDRRPTFHEIETYMGVVKVMTSEKSAETEVLRLNKINKDKGAFYFWTISRIIPD